jgi:hypothetical protein
MGGFLATAVIRSACLYRVIYRQYLLRVVNRP